MKNSIIVLFMSFYISVVQGQTNKDLFKINTISVQGQVYENPFGTSSTSFNFLQIIPDAIVTDSIYSIGNTIIQEKEYKTFLSNNGDKYFIRAEANFSKIYQYIDDTEYLVMDLNLTENDTFFHHLVNSLRIDTLIVDSVYFENERKHIQFNFPTHAIVEEKFEFIEGIGTNNGLFLTPYFPFNYYYVDEAKPYLLCAYRNEINVYMNNSFYYKNKCHVSEYESIDNPIDIKIISNDLNAKIFPNPVEDLLSIKINVSNHNYNIISIINLNGKTVFTQKINSNEFQLNIANLTSGLYIIKIMNNNNINYSKLIKK